MRINDYVALSMAQSNLMNQLYNNIQKSNERLSTGKRINSAADDPSAMYKISRMESKIREQGVLLKEHSKNYREYILRLLS